MKPQPQRALSAFCAPSTPLAGHLSFLHDNCRYPLNPLGNAGRVTKALNYGRDTISSVTAMTYPSGKVLGVSYGTGSDKR
jgi:hypothetical protein